MICPVCNENVDRVIPDPNYGRACGDCLYSLYEEKQASSKNIRKFRKDIEED